VEREWNSHVGGCIICLIFPRTYPSLYTVCERKKRAQEALAYNALVQRWPEIARLAEE
jgi:hypothetical protein